MGSRAHAEFTKRADFGEQHIPTFVQRLGCDEAEARALGGLDGPRHRTLAVHGEEAFADLAGHQRTRREVHHPDLGVRIVATASASSVLSTPTQRRPRIRGHGERRAGVSRNEERRAEVHARRIEVERRWGQSVHGRAPADPDYENPPCDSHHRALPAFKPSAADHT